MPIRRIACRCALLFMSALPTACAVEDSRMVGRAQTRMIGMSEVDVESCLGVPDQHATFADVDVLTYYTNSSSSMNYSIPVIGGLSFNNGGNCHVTFDLRNSQVTKILYSGEKNAALAPDAYCAPILRTCMEQLESPKPTHAEAPR